MGKISLFPHKYELTCITHRYKIPHHGPRVPLASLNSCSSQPIFRSSVPSSSTTTPSQHSHHLFDHIPYFYFFHSTNCRARFFNLMGPTKGVENEDQKESSKITKPYLNNLVLSLLISIVGGSLLLWWLYKYHPTNRQLWMVPFGLILFFTPLIVWFSLIISDLCNSKSEEEDAFKMKQRIHPLDR